MLLQCGLFLVRIEALGPSLHGDTRPQAHETRQQLGLKAAVGRWREAHRNALPFGSLHVIEHDFNRGWRGD